MAAADDPQRRVAVLFVLCCAGIGYVALTAPQRPRLAQLAFLVVALFLLTNKVWSPQFSLWLVPLAVLALPHRRILLAWMTIDALVWVPRMLFLYGEQNRGLPEQWFTMHRPAARHRGDRVVRVGDSADLPAELDLVRVTTARSTTRRAACSTRRPTTRRRGCRNACDPRARTCAVTAAEDEAGGSPERASGLFSRADAGVPNVRTS